MGGSEDGGFAAGIRRLPPVPRALWAVLTIYVAGMVGMVAASAIRGLAESADLQWAGTEASRGTDWAVAGTGVGLLLGLGFAIRCLRRPPRAP